MTDTAVTWRGITIGGGGDFHVEEITGWDDLPDITSYDQARSRGHGDHTGSQYARARIVTVSGSIASPTARNTLARALIAGSPVETDLLEDLSIQTFGQVLTAGARLIRRSLPVGENYAAGVVPFALQWKCPDPLRYGAPQPPISTGLPTSTGGLVYPLTYGLTYGTAGNPGQVALTNPGTADAAIVFTVTGGLSSGFEVSAAGQRITYPYEVPAGQTLVIDTAAGSALVEGTADRRGYLTNSDWMQVPAGGSLTVQFTSLGGAYDPAATLTASTRPAYW
jgi:hypothetical protein